MVERIDRAWRICATGLCFSSFGLGGLVLRVVIFPLVSLLPWSRLTRQHVCRDIVHYSFRLFIRVMRTLGVNRCEVRHAERLQRPGLLIVANHPSLIDVIFLMAIARRADCVVRSGLARNPFTRGPVRAAGWVLNDAGAAMVDDCVASLRAGNSLMIFPEGTRTRPNEPMRLQRGAANIAVRGGFALTPVVIRCTPPNLIKGQRWWRVPSRCPRYVIDVHPDIHVGDLVAPGTEDALAVRQVTQSLSEFFTREVGREAA